MEQLFKFFLDLLNTGFKNNQAFFSLLIIVYSILALTFINNPKINRFLFKSLLFIGIISFSLILINSAITNVSNGRYSMQLAKCHKTVIVEQFTLELKRCNKLNTNVSFDLLISNIGKEREFIIYANNTRIFDFFGNENFAQKVSIGNRRKDSYSSTIFPNNTRIKATINFENVLLERDIIRLLEIHTSYTNFKFNNLVLSNKKL
jgi:hypothetical protein